MNERPNAWRGWGWNARFIAAAAVTALGGPRAAMAQPAKQPLDVNAVVPSKPAQPKVPQSVPERALGADAKDGGLQPAAAGKAAGEGGGDKPATGASPTPAVAPLDDSVIFTISRFILSYHGPHEDHPPIEYMLDTKVRLGVTDRGYVAPSMGTSTVDIRIGDVNEGGEERFHFSALKAIQQALVEELRDYGLIAVWVQFDPEEIGLDDNNQPADFREGKHQTMNLVLWTGKASQVRTIATGERLNIEGPERINNDDRVHQRIRANSPVQAGDLLWRDEIDDFVFRLNRHPGRRVDVAISATGGPENPEAAGVDYLVSENKVWSIYGQISNTGTKSTNEWRERFGFVNNQLTGRDDIFRVDYITSGFDESHAVTASYDAPLDREGRLRIKVFAGYNEFTASDVGQAQAGFSGRTYSGGADLTWNFFQYGSWFGDLVGGARYENIRLNDQTLGAEGKDNFLLPYLGLRAERATDRSTTSGGLTLEYSIRDIPNTRPVLNDVGRRNADPDWFVLKYDFGHSFYIEPLINEWMGAGKDGRTPLPKTLAHEVSLTVRGQLAFDNRLVANEEDVAGGLYSVRGYDESIAAGDNVFIASGEYRFHLARALGLSDPGSYGKKPMTWFGPDFRYTPQSEYGVADWDLILRAFTDFARTTNNKKLVGENDLTLWGAGVGAELQWKRNVSMRLDLGVALRDVNDNGNTTKSGDGRLHFSLTVLY